jgi:hypothetical protein
MHSLNPTRTALPLLLLIFCFQGISQRYPAGAGTAKVSVTAVDGFGLALRNVKVGSFVDEQGRDRLALFHNGLTASGVPFGRYRLTVGADDYWDSTLLVEVTAPDVSITVGLEWPGVENLGVTGRLQGKLAGFPPTWSDWWCKASGLYTRLEYESAVTPPDSHFDFGRVPPGVYLVTCVAKRKFIAVRTVRVTGGAAPFTIDYKPNEDREPVMP